jgi:hypothetical protein
MESGNEKVRIRNGPGLYVDGDQRMTEIFIKSLISFLEIKELHLEVGRASNTALRKMASRAVPNILGSVEC